MKNNSYICTRKDKRTFLCRVLIRIFNTLFLYYPRKFMYRNVRPPFGGSVHFFMSSIAEPSEMVTLSRWVGNQYRKFL